MTKKTSEDKLAKNKAQRDQAISDMPPELQEIYEEIKTKCESWSSNEILNAYAVGSMVRDVVSREQTYGESALLDLVLALGGQWTQAELLFMRQFAQRYGEKGIRQLTEKRTVGGHLLTLDHLRRVVETPSGDRDKWLRLIFQEDLTTRELAAAINEKYAKKPQPRSLTINPPRRVVSGLKQIRSYSNAVGVRVPIWDQHVFTKILKSASEDCTDELLDELDQTLEAERETIAHAEHIIERAEEAKIRVQHVIRLRKAPRSSSSAEGVATPDSPASEEPATRRPVVRKKANTEGKPDNEATSAKASPGATRRKKKKKETEA